jgi:hypothetical protein
MLRRWASARTAAWSFASLAAVALLSAAMSSCVARSRRCVSNDARIALCSAVASSAFASVGSWARNSFSSESSSSSPCSGSGGGGGGGGGAETASREHAVGCEAAARHFLPAVWRM